MELGRSIGSDAVTASVVAEYRANGSILVRSAIDLPPVRGTLPERLSHWARVAPQAVFLSEGSCFVTYGEAEAARRRLSNALLAMGFSGDRPLMILGENSINHALLMLAATAVGVPVAIVSPAYARLQSAPWAKLAHVINQIAPACVVADNVVEAKAALTGINECVPVRPLGDLEWLTMTPPIDANIVIDAELAITPNTIAKLLFTSGSTGSPKAVCNTQRMMVSNMQAIALIWPCLARRPPVLVDWLPWNHTFGGNCCFNIALWFGGHLHIDSGRPTSALIERTVAALRRYRPTVYFNVPIGFEFLIPVLERDEAFAADFLGQLDFILNGGAAMPASLRVRLETVSLAVTGRRVNIVGGWGSTETAPFSTALPFFTEHAANLGLPIPGTTIKMVPLAGHYELRVRGPNVTPGYWRDDATTDKAFDDEGFYRIGDAGKFVNPENPAEGILFDGRVWEDFKLTTGTFVNVGTLRLAIISAGEKLISDAVIAGEGRSELGALLFANESACRAYLGPDLCATLGNRRAESHPTIQDRIADLLRSYNTTATGSSTRIARFLIAEEPLSSAHDEITDKGYINQRRVLARRAEVVSRLFEMGIVP